MLIATPMTQGWQDASGGGIESHGRQKASSSPSIGGSIRFLMADVLVTNYPGFGKRGDMMIHIDMTIRFD